LRYIVEVVMATKKAQRDIMLALDLTSTKTRLFIVTALLLLGALFRVHNMGAQDLWGDEAWTWYLTTQDDFWGTLASDVHPPLYFGSLYVWENIVGDSEVALRYLSVLFGMLGLATLYRLARELRHWRKGIPLAFPLVAVLLMAIADMEVHVAQEARTYSLQIWLAILSTFFYLRWARQSGKRWALLWVLVNVGIVHTHYLGALTPVAQGVHALLFLTGRKRLQAIGWLVLSAVLFIPWMLNVVLGRQLGIFSGNLPADPSTWATLWKYRISFFTQQWVLQLGITLLGLVIFVYGKDGAWRGWRLRPLAMPVLLALWAIVPLTLAFIANTQLPILFDYRISQIVPPLILLLALGIMNFRPPERLFLLVVIVGYGMLMTDVYRPKPDWSAYGELVTQYVQDDDAVLSDFSGGDYTVTYYLSRLLPEDVPVRSMWQWRYWEADTYEAGIFAYIQAHETVWVPFWNDASNEIFERMALVDYVQTDVRDFDLYGSTLQVLRFDAPIMQDAIPLAQFDNGMTLIEAELNSRGGASLLWRADTSLESDYTIAVFLLDEAGNVITQTDSAPATPTSQWQSNALYFDGKVLDVPEDILDGGYELGVAVYEWSPDGITNALTNGETLWRGTIGNE
jgi:hypothetical protein